jgi:predicted peptidase
MKPLLLLLALVGLLAAGCRSGTPGIRAVSGSQTQNRLRQEVRTSSELGYLLYMPKGKAPSPDGKWPLVLFLHGAGERGTNLAQVAVHGPPKLAASGRDLPFILVSPQCPSGEVWDARQLVALLEFLQASLPADPRRTYVTGLSMGGYGTWDLISRHPGRFAAAAPICGGGECIRLLLLEPTQREALKTLPVKVFHGGKDGVVPLEESQRMVEAFRKAGCRGISLTVYPDAGHDSWTETYSDAGFFPWLLSHSR